MTREGGWQSIRSRAAGPLRGRQDDGPGRRTPRSRRCSRRASERSAPDARRLPRDAGRLRPADGARPRSARRAGSHASGSLSWRCSAPRASFAAAARRSGSRRITIGFARCWPPDCSQTPCAEIHGLMVQTLVEQAGRRLRGAVRALSRAPETREHAAIQAGLAAEKAGAALAFDRAVVFYRHALALAPASATRAAHGGKDSPRRWPTPAGRPTPPTPICAPPKEQVVASASSSSAAAAEQLLIGGHIDRGLDLIRTGLADTGMAMPRSPVAALLWLLWRRARLRWRGLRFVPRPVERHRAPTPSFASIPAGRRRRDCCRST